MGWPLSRYQDFVDNTVPAITAAFLHALEDAQGHVYRGTQTLKALVVDGTGGAAASPTAGDISASRSLRVGRTSAGSSMPTATVDLGEVTRGQVVAGWAVYDGASMTRGVRVTSFVRNGTGDYTVTFSPVLVDAANVVPLCNIVVGSGSIVGIVLPFVDLSVSGGGLVVAHVRTRVLGVSGSTITNTAADSPFVLALLGE